MTKRRAGQDDDGVAKRRDDAIRRALNTPPKPHKDMKKGKGGKKPQDKPTASQKP